MKQPQLIELLPSNKNSHPDLAQNSSSQSDEEQQIEIPPNTNISKKILLKTLIKCEVCGTNVRENHLNRHMLQVHPNLAQNVSKANEKKQSVNDQEQLSVSHPLIDVNESGFSSNVSQRFGPFIKTIFKCKACDTAGFLESHFSNHLSRMHKSDKTIDDSIFEPHSANEMIHCMCGREISRNKMNKHMKEHLSGVEHFYIFGAHVN